MYIICIYVSKKFWRILIWRLLKQTAKPPNLIPCQIFWLYGTIFIKYFFQVLTDILSRKKKKKNDCSHISFVIIVTTIGYMVSRINISNIMVSLYPSLFYGSLLCHVHVLNDCFFPNQYP